MNHKKLSSTGVLCIRFIFHSIVILHCISFNVFFSVSISFYPPPPPPPISLILFFCAFETLVRGLILIFTNLSSIFFFSKNGFNLIHQPNLPPLISHLSTAEERTLAFVGTDTEIYVRKRHSKTKEFLKLPLQAASAN